MSALIACISHEEEKGQRCMDRVSGTDDVLSGLTFTATMKLIHS